MTISDSIPSFRLPRLRRPWIRQVGPVVLALLVAASAISEGYGSIDAILALTAALTMIGGVYWLGRSAGDRETSSITDPNGLAGFTYDEAGIRDVVGTFSALREPGVPISAEITRITRITGITADMVAGQRIDLDTVARFAEPADLVIAHNARFDRPFVERFAPGFDAKPWACSVAEIDWTALGFEGSKLGYLVGQCGWFHNGHRAVDDCHALLEVLAHRSRTEAPDPFHQLVASAARTRLRVYAIGSPFHTKDILKARGYRWSV